MREEPPSSGTLFTLGHIATSESGLIPRKAPIHGDAEEAGSELECNLDLFLLYLALGARTKLVLKRQTPLLLLYDATINSRSTKFFYIGHCQSSGGCHSPTDSDSLCKFRSLTTYYWVPPHLTVIAGKFTIRI